VKSIEPLMGAREIMAITGLSRAFVYALMRQMGATMFGRSIRVERAVFVKWLEARRQEPCGDRGNEAVSGGGARPSTEKRTRVRHAKKTAKRPNSCSGDGIEKMPTLHTQPRRRQPSKARASA
jgi:predicted DNA-binding transcriptional regulator AlpA